MDVTGTTRGAERPGFSEFTASGTVAPPTAAPEAGMPLGPPGGGAADPAASRRWRTVWRVHFYAGMFALPILVLLSLTGLVILYTDPIQNATQGHLRSVVPGTETVSLDEQPCPPRRPLPPRAGSGRRRRGRPGRRRGRWPCRSPGTTR